MTPKGPYQAEPGRSLSPEPTPSDARVRSRTECLNYADALEGALHLLDDEDSAQILAVLADQWRAEAESTPSGERVSSCPACAGAMPADQMGLPLQDLHAQHQTSSRNFGTRC